MKNAYFKTLTGLFSAIEATEKDGLFLEFSRAHRAAVRLLENTRSKNKVFLVGNGGSASIASHIAVDFLKNGRISAYALNDPSFLTCMSNDYGYEYVFSKPLETLIRKGDVLLAISSSGASANILGAAASARKKGANVITFSGFMPDNPLRTCGAINFYVPSSSYGYVEIVHLAVCHEIADALTGKMQLESKKR
ncbi:MAG: SIS domain-containing protein [Candidatus Omnitrophota bacterium]